MGVVQQKKMVQKNRSLSVLRRAVARERARVTALQTRRGLERKLRMLKRSGRTDVLGRIGRGFVILSKKVGGATLKQARLIRERQIREAKTIRKRGRRTTSDGFFDPIGSLEI